MLILPLGDEPDFARIAPKYIDFLNFFQISNFDESLKIVENQDAIGQFGFEVYAVSDCKYITNPYQFFGVYDFDSCFKGYTLAIKRTVLTLLIYLPLLTLAFKVSRTQSNKNVLLPNEYLISNKAFQLCFLFPAFIYCSSVFSLEQVTLMLSVLFVFTLLKTRYIFALLLFSLLYILDTGNAIVVLGVSCYVIGSLIICRNLSFLWFFLLNLSLLLFLYFLSTDLLYLIEPIHPYLSLKLEELEFAQSISADVSNKYPLWSRPFMTYLSFNFMSPAFSKHFLLYALVTFGLLYTIYTRVILRKLDSIDFLYLTSVLAVFSCISMIVFILPGHNNAKYFIFTLPFILNIFLYYYSHKTLVKFLLLLNAIVLLDYLLFYSIGCVGKSCVSFFGIPY
jgi:hypothetical protein